MASFTDLPPQFTPYVPQLPIEAMVQVGMAKQAKYEQGVQKIQAQIDQIAGMDILRDVDKNYLQSKLNELGNNLTMFAAADFSNFQLVNSVAGMTKQIARDKRIEKDVSSTAWYRKQSKEMEKAISEGKSSQSNIWDFTQKASDYANSTDPDRAFSDRYTQYTDVKKKAMEAIKALHPNLQKYDIPFEVKDGQINTAVIADAMKRYKIEGIDESQIKAAITATLTPDDLNQLSIDGRYQFRDVTPDRLEKIAINTYEKNKKDAESKLSYLEEKRKITTDPTKLGEIDSQIEYYQSLIGSDDAPGILYRSFQENIANIRTNPDGVKTSIYKDGFIKEFANAFSWESTDMEYVKSPIRDQMNWVEEMKLKQAVEQRQRSEFAWKKQMDIVGIEQKNRENELKAEANALEYAKVYGVDSPWVTLGNPTDNTLMAEKMLIDHSSGVEQNYKSNEAALSQAGYSQVQINKMVNDESTPVPSRAMSIVQEMRKQKVYLQSLKDFQERTKAEANNEVLNSKEYKQKVTAANAFASSINGGRPVTLTEKWQGRGVPSRKLTITPKEMIENLNSGKADLTIDGGTIRYQQGDFVMEMPRSAGLDPNGLRPIFEKISEYGKMGYFRITKDAAVKADELYREKLSPVVSKFVPQIKVLRSDKDGTLTAAGLGQISALITAVAARGVAADDVWSTATASEMLTAKYIKDTRAFVKQQGDNYELILKNESAPTKLQRIKLSKSEILANFGEKYVNNLTQESIRLDLGRGNTNINMNPTQSTMQKSFGDFPGIRRMNITADLERDLGNPDLFIPRINIMKKNGKYINFELSGIDKLSRVGFEQGRKNLNALTDDVLLRYLKIEYPNYNFSELDIK